MSQLPSVLPLPHRYPFLLLDRIVELEPGAAAIATRGLTMGDPLVDAEGYLPPVLLVEAIAQCAGLAVLGGSGDEVVMLAAIDRFRASARRARAGDRLEITVRVVRRFGGTAKVRGVVRVDGRVRAAADVGLWLSPRRRPGDAP